MVMGDSKNLRVFNSRFYSNRQICCSQNIHVLLYPICKLLAIIQCTIVMIKDAPIRHCPIYGRPIIGAYQLTQKLNLLSYLFI